MAGGSPLAAAAFAQQTKSVSTQETVLRREDRAKATATAKAKDSSEMMWSAKKEPAIRQIDSG
jgi:hypothetical protein